MTMPYVPGELMNPQKFYDRIESRLKQLELAATRMQATQQSTSALTNGSFVPILNMQRSVDTIGFAASASQYTVPAGGAGVYRVAGQVTFAAGATRNVAGVAVNGSVVVAANSGSGSTAVTATIAPFEIAVSVGDVITLQGYVNAASISTYILGGGASFIRIEKIL